MEGKRIAVWVYSNLDKVELLHNGQSLGTKEMKKDSHVAWVVQYAPGTIEARGYKGDKVVMTTKRETTGPAARLSMSADRQELSGDGEDVAIFAVEVRDAQGRVVPITDNEVTFKVSSEGKLIGVGNGDPTDQGSDKGTSRKAFCGYCMAVAQSTKQGGNITIKATSRGLAPATVTLPVKAVTLRPQVPLWERQIPKGEGVTGLWRPMPPEGGSESSAPAGDAIYSFKQEGSSLNGTVEGTGATFFGGGDVPAPIVNGTISGNTISFKAGTSTFTGNIKGDRIELQRSAAPAGAANPPEKASDAPDIGPAPDGSDPSRGPTRPPSSVPVVLSKVER
jgi:beta-galactosidase